MHAAISSGLTVRHHIVIVIVIVIGRHPLALCSVIVIAVHPLALVLCRTTLHHSLIDSAASACAYAVERMKGSVMDRMSEAVEGAEVILYGVSNHYKESAK